jgi:RNA polymerase sigma-70 factor, ECF subfamily
LQGSLGKLSSTLVSQLSSIVVLSVIDRTLLNRCIEGAPGAWEDFVDRFIALISHVVSTTGELRLGSLSEQSRDDIVAEIFLRLVENDFAILRRFRGQSSLGTYLVVVSRRIAIRRLTQMSRASNGSRPLSVEPEGREENGQLDMENTEEVQSLLAKMPTPEATAIRMYHMEERTYKEISSQIGIPENSVGPLLSKARSRLRSLRDA